MKEPLTSDPEEMAVLVSELIEASMEKDPRSVFEQRAILGRARLTIQSLRTGRPFDPVFDGEQSALAKVEQVHRSIANCPDHHIRAAMLIAAQLLDMLQPSPGSPLARALRHHKIGGNKSSDREMLNS